MLSNPLISFLLKIIIFVAIIYTLQCGFEYLKTTYTKPKVKDLVNTQIQKYKEIVAEMNNPVVNDFVEVKDENTELFTERVNVNDMNNELLTFMNSQTQQYVTEP
tara:strand:+ start:16364 stop:16678 length:315 start_codon:yes stop_codon:yes gene_type:complete